MAYPRAVCRVCKTGDCRACKHRASVRRARKAAKERERQRDEEVLARAREIAPIRTPKVRLRLTPEDVLGQSGSAH